VHHWKRLVAVYFYVLFPTLKSSVFRLNHARAKIWQLHTPRVAQVPESFPESFLHCILLHFIFINIVSSRLQSNMGEGKAFDEATSADTAENSYSESSAARPPPSAPPLEEDTNLPVATPVNECPSGTSGGDVGGAQETSTASMSTPEETQKNAAGIAAAVLGFFFGGPFLSLIFGGGTYYAATHRPVGDVAGDAARSLGDIALVVRDRAIKYDEKHDIVNKGKNAAGSLWQKTKAKGEELDAKHDIVSKGKSLVERVFAKAVELNNEHRILERTRLLVGNLLTMIGNKLSGGTDAQQQQGDQQQRQTAGGSS
jgi:hypothetical protein